MNRCAFTVVAALCLASLAVAGRAVAADDTPRAARSVHLAYANPFPENGCASFYVQVRVEQSTGGSYFQACGFNHGYFGIQELTDGKKVAIFSVWDPTRGNDPHAVAAKDQCEVLFSCEGARIKRFGGEGTGAQCIIDCDWKLNEASEFYLTAAAGEHSTTYDAYLRVDAGKPWKRLATFRTRTDGKLLLGLYSFIEDFRRDHSSVNEIRRATFGNGWVGNSDGRWAPLGEAHFTASNAAWESKDNIDAGSTQDGFYLATGGNISASTALGSMMHRGSQPPTAK